MGDKSEIIIYQTDDGLTKIDVRLDEDTVWLTQAEMAELFQKNVSTISRHIQNVFEKGELQKNECNLRFLQIANSDKPIALYSLDVIISVVTGSNLCVVHSSASGRLSAKGVHIIRCDKLDCCGLKA